MNKTSSYDKAGRTYVSASIMSFFFRLRPGVTKNFSKVKSGSLREDAAGTEKISRDVGPKTENCSNFETQKLKGPSPLIACFCLSPKDSSKSTNCGHQ